MSDLPAAPVLDTQISCWPNPHACEKSIQYRKPKRERQGDFGGLGFDRMDGQDPLTADTDGGTPHKRGCARTDLAQ